MTDWSINELSPGELLIQDGEKVVGSIKKDGDFWLVEILWSGPGGDLTFKSMHYTSALAFIEGVEKTLRAVLAAGEER